MNLRERSGDGSTWSLNVVHFLVCACRSSFPSKLFGPCTVCPYSISDAVPYSTHYAKAGHSLSIKTCGNHLWATGVFVLLIGTCLHVKPGSHPCESPDLLSKGPTPRRLPPPHTCCWGWFDLERDRDNACFHCFRRNLAIFQVFLNGLVPRLNVWILGCPRKLGSKVKSSGLVHPNIPQL